MLFYVKSRGIEVTMHKVEVTIKDNWNWHPAKRSKKEVA